ncbi:hypothetical protein AURDEDRAFT_169295 [Auricularia subglabra TFB-10046 SS5]|nr:hypothetical protein AURDEDRAFT_169295 [Auricularia subglabra TFB-10046 SS5]
MAPSPDTGQLSVTLSCRPRPVGGHQHPLCLSGARPTSPTDEDTGISPGEGFDLQRVHSSPHPPPVPLSGNFIEDDDDEVETLLMAFSPPHSPQTGGPLTPLAIATIEGDMDNDDGATSSYPTGQSPNEFDLPPECAYPQASRTAHGGLREPKERTPDEGMCVDDPHNSSPGIVTSPAVGTSLDAVTAARSQISQPAESAREQASHTVHDGLRELEGRTPPDDDMCVDDPHDSSPGIDTSPAVGTSLDAVTAAQIQLSRPLKSAHEQASHTVHDGLRELEGRTPPNDDMCVDDPHDSSSGINTSPAIWTFADAVTAARSQFSQPAESAHEQAKHTAHDGLQELEGRSPPDESTDVDHSHNFTVTCIDTSVNSFRLDAQGPSCVDESTVAFTADAAMAFNHDLSSHPERTHEQASCIVHHGLQDHAEHTLPDEGMSVDHPHDYASPGISTSPTETSHDSNPSNPLESADEQASRTVHDCLQEHEGHTLSDDSTTLDHPQEFKGAGDHTNLQASPAPMAATQMRQTQRQRPDPTQSYLVREDLPPPNESMPDSSEPPPPFHWIFGPVVPVEFEGRVRIRFFAI